MIERKPFTPLESGRKIFRPHWFVPALLFLILVTGAFFRFYNLDWDKGYHFHPDERAIMEATLRLNPAPNWETFWTPASPMNPKFFAYGSLPFYLTKGVSSLLGRFQRQYLEYGGVRLVGRGLSALLDLGTIFLVFLIGRRLFSTRVGLLGAAFAALTVLQVQLAHFYAVDPVVATFLALGMYGGVRVMERGSLRWGLLLGAGFGLALASKFSAAPFGATVIAAWLLWAWPARGDRQPGQRFSWRWLIAGLLVLAAAGLLLVRLNIIETVFGLLQGPGGQPSTSPPLPLIVGGLIAGLVVAWLFSLIGQPASRQTPSAETSSPALPSSPASAEEQPPLADTQYPTSNLSSSNLSSRFSRALFGIVIGLAAALVVFFIGEPYAFIDWASFIRRVFEESNMVRGIADLPYTRQYIGTPAYLYQIEQAIKVSYGLPLGIAAFIGLAYSLYKALFRQSRADILLLSWVLVYFLIDGAFMVKFLRYMVVILPFLSLMGARLLWDLYDRVPDVKYWISEIVARVRRVPSPQPANPQYLIPKLQLTWGRVVTAALISSIVLFSFLYCLAFLNIYNQKHPWVQISEWIYRNVPPRSVVTDEHWDDRMPLGLQVDGRGRVSEEFTYKNMPLYEVDDATKLNLIIDRARTADYIFLATNRLYGSIAPLAGRYPITRRYYELLFNGQLGFELVAFAAVYPSLGPVTLVDDTFIRPDLPVPSRLQDYRPTPLTINLGHVDESFTVYDHPKPMVFKRVRTLSEAELRALFAGTLEQAEAYRNRPRTEPGRPATAPQTEEQRRREMAKTKPLLMDEAARDAQEAAGTFSELFDRGGLADQTAPLLWWLAIQGIGWIAFPITFLVFRRFRDRGYALSKSLGILLAAYPVWLIASLKVLPYTRWTIFLSIGVIALVSGLILRQRLSEIRAFISREQRLLLSIEALFLIAYVVFLLIRRLNPDLWQPWNGGEKPMEFAFFNAAIRTAYFPPYDPYYAGGYINYYYYGLYLVGFLTKLTGILPSIAFNVAVPSLFALTVLNAFTIAYNLVDRGWRPVSGEPVASLPAGGSPATLSNGGPASLDHRPTLVGLMAGLFVAVIGNLAGMVQLVNYLWNAGGAQFESTLPLVAGLVKTLAGLQAVLIQHKPLPAFNYWDPTRVIPFTINEFPYFSFLFADLHPHMIGIPFTLVVLALALNLVKEGRAGEDDLQNVAGRPLVVLGLPVRTAEAAGEEPAGEERSPKRRRRRVTPATESLPTDLLSEDNHFSEGAPGLIVPITREAPPAAVEAEAEAAPEMLPIETAIAPETPLPPVEAAAGPPSLPARQQFTITLQSLRSNFHLQSLFPWIVLALALGSLFPINSWDLPTYLGIVVVSLALRQWVGRRQINLVELVGQVALVGILSLGFYWPFLSSYAALVSGIAPVRNRTEIQYYLAIWGFFLFLLISFLVVEFGRDRESGLPKLFGLIIRKWDYAHRIVALYRRLVTPTTAFRATLSGLMILFVVTALLFLAKLYLFALLLPLLVLTVALAWRNEQTPERLFTYLLFFTGLLISLGVEIVSLNDFLGGGEYQRMNTIFKFYIQVWTFFAIGGAVVSGKILAIRDWRFEASLSRTPISNSQYSITRLAWLFLFGVLLLSVLVYPLFATGTRVNDRFPGDRPAIGTLDGLAFMSVGSYTFDWERQNHKVELAYDLAAIHWLMDNVKGTPVIAEAVLPYYREMGVRVASFTGLPTLLGMHQNEQRYDWQVQQREQEARTLFTDPDLEKAMTVIRQLRVRYVYIGQLERSIYPAAGIDKFERGVGRYFDVVYENPKVKIYAVRR